MAKDAEASGLRRSAAEAGILDLHVQRERCDHPGSTQHQHEAQHVQDREHVADPRPESADYAVNAVPHGTVALQWYASPTVGASRRTYVYTPAGYETGSDRYPVLYLLHGGSGDEDAWSSCGRASQILDQLDRPGQSQADDRRDAQRQHHADRSPRFVPAPPALPAIQDPGRFRRFPESLVKDLVPFVDKTYRTERIVRTAPIAGLSVGGAQTMYAAFNNLDLFAWVAAFSGGYPVMPGVAIDVPPPPNAASLRGRTSPAPSIQ